MIRTIPSPDAGFREHVERLLTRWPDDTAAAFEARLRRLFPRTVVRPRELSGEPMAVWYVYRDGAWRPPEDVPWWQSGTAARAIVDGDGWIVEANAAALGLLGIPDVADEPRHVTDFVAPGALQDATDLWEIVLRGASLDATTLIRPAAGPAIAVEIHAAAADGHVLVDLRLADDIAAAAAPAPPPPALDCRPAYDAAFRSHVELALARMPEPSAGGLAIRLRRRYPHARVEIGPERWLVTRDGSEQAALAAGEPGATAETAPEASIPPGPDQASGADPAPASDAAPADIGFVPEAGPADLGFAPGAVAGA